MLDSGTIMRPSWANATGMHEANTTTNIGVATVNSAIERLTISCPHLVSDLVSYFPSPVNTFPGRSGHSSQGAGRLSLRDSLFDETKGVSPTSLVPRLFFAIAVI